MVDDPRTLSSFYEQAYSSAPEQAELYSRWRALGALGKADHVIELCARAGLEPQHRAGRRLRRRGAAQRAFPARLRGHAHGPRAERRGGRDRPRASGDRRAWSNSTAPALPAGEGEYDLGILSHVLEHVPDPPALLGEVARACRAVVIEVPLEAEPVGPAGLQAGPRAARSATCGASTVTAARAIVAGAGLRVAGELEDPLPLEVHLFFARGPAQRARAI